MLGSALRVLGLGFRPPVTVHGSDLGSKVYKVVYKQNMVIIQLLLGGGSTQNQ